MKTFCLLLVLCTSIGLISQPQLEWSSIYSGGQFSQDRGFDIVIDDNLNVYSTGYSRLSGDYYNYMTIKYSPYGDTLWTRRYDKCYYLFGCDNFAHTINLDNTGNIYVGGIRSIIKYDGAGNTIWIKDSLLAVKVLIYNNQYLYIAGESYNNSNGYNRFITYKLDLNGNIIWSRLFFNNGADQNHPTDMVIDSQGNIIVTGYSNKPTPNAHYDYVTIKYNNNGDSVWVKRYDSGQAGDDYAYGVAVDSLDNVFVTGDSRFSGSPTYLTIKYNSFGDTLWTKRFSNAGSFGSDIAIDRLGNIIVTGNTCNSYCYTTLKYTTNGNLIWSRLYQQTTSFTPYFNMIKLDNSDNVYVNVSGATPPDSSGIRIIKYDSSGNTVWTAYHRGGSGEQSSAIGLDKNNNVYATGIMQQKFITLKFSQALTNLGHLSNELPNEFNLEQNYPNPFNPSTKIKFEIPKSSRVKLIIYDLLGREISKIVNEELKLGTYEIEWDASNFASGIYFYTIETNEYSETRKLILLK